MNSASGGAAARSSRQQSVYHLMIYLHGDVFPKCPLQGKFQNKCLCPILNCILGAVIISHRCRGMCVLWKMAQARVPQRFIEKSKFQQYINIWIKHGQLVFTILVKILPRDIFTLPRLSPGQFYEQTKFHFPVSPRRGVRRTGWRLEWGLVSCSAVKRSIGSTIGFHNHGEGPY